MGTSWSYVADSVIGDSHARVGEACQDANNVGVLSSCEGEVLVVACADGAGSASCAREGASHACAAALRYLEEYLSAGKTVEGLSHDLAVNWVQCMRAELTRLAEVATLDVREYACTLLVVIVSETHIFGMQVGDGAIIVSMDSQIKPLFWPDQGEYANSTTFITSRDADDRLLSTRLGTKVDKVAVITDGLQRLALNFSDKTAHAPFF